jgi:hypothetical protein
MALSLVASGRLAKQAIFDAPCHDISKLHDIGNGILRSRFMESFEGIDEWRGEGIAEQCPPPCHAGLKQGKGLSVIMDKPLE